MDWVKRKQFFFVVLNIPIDRMLYQAGIFVNGEVSNKGEYVASVQHTNVHS